MNALAINMLDFDLDRTPTALEAAHYNALLQRETDAKARQVEAAQIVARTIFGECLLGLTKLGMKEGQARGMLGKWRGKAQDDQLLIRIVRQAINISTPDPIGYVTRALAGAGSRQASAVTREKGKWELIGWEKPRMTAKGAMWKHGTRGQVWRDPFGVLKVLPAKEGAAIPGLDEDPGVEAK